MYLRLRVLLLLTAVTALSLTAGTVTAQNVLNGGNAFRSSSGKGLSGGSSFGSLPGSLSRTQVVRPDSSGTVAARGAGLPEADPGAPAPPGLAGSGTTDTSEPAAHASSLFGEFGQRPNLLTPYLVSRGAVGLNEIDSPNGPLGIAGQLFSSAAQAAVTRARPPSPSTTVALLSGTRISETIIPDEEEQNDLRQQAREMFRQYRAAAQCSTLAGDGTWMVTPCGSNI